MISAPNDEDWAYSQQLSALSGQACNFGEWEATSLLLSHTTLLPVNSKMEHRTLDHQNDSQFRLFRFPDTYSIILSIKLLLDWSFSLLWIFFSPSIFSPL